MRDLYDAMNNVACFSSRFSSRFSSIRPDCYYFDMSNHISRGAYIYSNNNNWIYMTLSSKSSADSTGHSTKNAHTNPTDRDFLQVNMDM